MYSRMEGIALIEELYSTLYTESYPQHQYPHWYIQISVIHAINLYNISVTALAYLHQHIYTISMQTSLVFAHSYPRQHIHTTHTRTQTRTQTRTRTNASTSSTNRIYPNPFNSSTRIGSRPSASSKGVSAGEVTWLAGRWWSTGRVIRCQSWALECRQVSPVREARSGVNLDTFFIVIVVVIIYFFICLFLRGY